MAWAEVGSVVVLVILVERFPVVVVLVVLGDLGGIPCLPKYSAGIVVLVCV